MVLVSDFKLFNFTYLTYLTIIITIIGSHYDEASGKDLKPKDVGGSDVNSSTPSCDANGTGNGNGKEKITSMPSSFPTLQYPEEKHSRPTPNILKRSRKLNPELPMNLYGSSIILRNEFKSKLPESPIITPIKSLPFSPSQFLKSPCLTTFEDMNLRASTPVPKTYNRVGMEIKKELETSSIETPQKSKYITLYIILIYYSYNKIYFKV